MKWIQFPKPQTANEDGILAIGGNLKVNTLVSAYSQGIFPWPSEGQPLLWFCPWERGILEFSDLHVSKSLQKLSRKTQWTFTVNKNFSEVIRACAQTPRADQAGTWITNPMVEAYIELHLKGFAHSFEVWEENVLIGGIYGVFVKNVFSAESMFHHKSNASKWGFYKLITFLQNLGLNWIDVQMVTNISESFGAKLISQDEFLNKLASQQTKMPISW